MASVTKNDVPRCPYCVSGTVFTEMKVLENGRHICEKCGHIVFPDNRVLSCPCPRCLEGRFSSVLRNLRR
jgi:ribosomal protein S27AE